ncbi:YtxH domain-containing protein [Lacticigenium naphthae]|uniref:YtxH domain-containing protein n=1 Tax=Lacticigenium naphthae TaxID=515351 RepID=UPI00040825A1|nr:YtxH domain-containing protein [Lacticigenium naphthae]
MSKFGFGKGLLTGVIAGGIYGLVKTPRTGKENQEIAKEYIDDAAYHFDDVTLKVKNLKNSIQRLVDEGKTINESVVPAVEKTVKEFQYDMEPRVRRIQEKMDKINDDVEQLNQAFPDNNVNQ